MGWYRDPRSSNPLATKVLETSYTAKTFVSQVPIPIPMVSDRELLGRSVYLKDDEGGGEGTTSRCCYPFAANPFSSAAASFTNVAYSLENAVQPPASDKVRVESLFCFVVRPAPGSEGRTSECWRVNRANFKFRKGLGVLNTVVAEKVGQVIASPLNKLKVDVERRLQEYVAGASARERSEHKRRSLLARKRRRLLERSPATPATTRKGSRWCCRFERAY
jgi:hypothetical protein